MKDYRHKYLKYKKKLLRVGVNNITMGKSNQPETKIINNPHKSSCVCRYECTTVIWY